MERHASVREWRAIGIEQARTHDERRRLRKREFVDDFLACGRGALHLQPKMEQRALNRQREILAEAHIAEPRNATATLRRAVGHAAIVLRVLVAGQPATPERSVGERLLVDAGRTHAKAAMRWHSENDLRLAVRNRRTRRDESWRTHVDLERRRRRASAEVLLGAHHQHALVVRGTDAPIVEVVVHLAAGVASKEPKRDTNERRTVEADDAHRDFARRSQPDLDSLFAELLAVGTAKSLFLVREDHASVAHADPRATC